MKKSVDKLKFPLKEKYVAMLAPSFIVDFSYPSVISQLKQLGFDKAVELTFGAKMINRDYYKNLGKGNLVIASVCPGIVETIKRRFPQYEQNLVKVDSPMIATGKICRKTFPKHKIVFISPCNFKKTEAKKSRYVDYVVDYQELKNLFAKFKIKKNRTKNRFDKFYNDYTKIYPLAGGLSKTAHLKNIIKFNEVRVIDGMNKVIKFLEHPKKGVRFLDVTFCKGGCIGGPCINSRLPVPLRKIKVLNYSKKARKESIPRMRKGLVEKARGISFKSEYLSNK